MSAAPVAITGVGMVNAAVVGGADSLARWIAAPPESTSTLAIAPERLAELVGGADTRRLSRACQLGIAGARLALADAGLATPEGLGLVVGTEFGDLHATREFVDGYLDRGPAGLSPLLFPNTVMNVMAATTAIAVQARELSLSLVAPTVAGEIAVARAAATIVTGRADAVLAGGLDEMDPVLVRSLAALGPAGERRAEGAAFLVLEREEHARARGARVLGRIVGVGRRALQARPGGIGRGSSSRAIPDALAAAHRTIADVGRVLVSASGDVARDRWEHSCVTGALAPSRPPLIALAARVGQHSGLGPLRVAAAALAASDGGHGRVGLVYALARGGAEVAIVVGGGES